AVSGYINLSNKVLQKALDEEGYKEVVIDWNNLNLFGVWNYEGIKDALDANDDTIKIQDKWFSKDHNIGQRLVERFKKIDEEEMKAF
ncbi:MAG: hypothetical protein RLZZ347_704, partial [Candidatus Parcubacteria bacterium]